MKAQFAKTTITAALLAAVTGVGCTSTVPGSFRLAQQTQTFSSQQDVNTKIDLLWVVDNSASMDVSQEKLRQGFASFARRYMQPTWDIRVAVITTDTYLANPAFSDYLGRTIPNTTNWTSPHVASRLSTFVNPTTDTSLVNLTTGKFGHGLKYGQLTPAWGPNYAKLLPGNHDGPIASFCIELLPYFTNGVTHCGVRDDQTRYSGVSHCLNPDSSAGEVSGSQCVNTVENDTIHTGKAIIDTLPPAGVAGDAAWTNQLIADFTINMTTGTAGQGSERGLGSVLQLLTDNEPGSTAFFRKNSLRGIIFVSDEDDQTMSLPNPVPAGFSPQSKYKCDQASLLTLNAANAITGNGGMCCTDTSKNCSYGSEGISCDPKTVDGYTYTISTCPRPELLAPVADIKSTIDTFFKSLDGGAATDPNYFVASIVALTGTSIQQLQALHDADDAAVGALHTVAADRADRYLQLGDLVGNGSLSMNIAESDYTPILNAIGQTIIDRKGTFTLERAPTNAEDMILMVIHADGTTTTIPSSKFVINANHVTITDGDYILSLAATDKISINYQPKTLN